MLTTKQLYNVKDRSKFMRSEPISNFSHLTKHNETNNWTFGVHIIDNYDYIFESEQRDEIFQYIKESYFYTMNANLPVFGVNGKIKDFVTTKDDAKKGFNRVP